MYYKKMILMLVRMIDIMHYMDNKYVEITEKLYFEAFLLKYYFISHLRIAKEKFK